MGPASSSLEGVVGGDPVRVAELLSALAAAAHAAAGLEPDGATLLPTLRRLRDAWGKAGVFTLEVLPGEIRLSGNVVYREADLERSLASRLAAGGLHTLAFRSDPEHRDALPFLELVARCYSPAAANGNDLAARLQEARLLSVFVPGPEAPSAGTGIGCVPRTPAGPPVALAWVEPTQEDRQRLHAEESPEALRAQGLRALTESVAGASGEAVLDRVLRLLRPLKDAFLLEGRPDLEAVGALVRTLHQAARKEPRVLPLLESFCQEPTLRALAAGAPTEEAWPPADLVGLLDLLPSAPLLAALLDWMAAETDPVRRRRVGALVEACAHSQPDVVVARLREAPPALAVELLRLCARAIPGRVAEGALGFVFDDDTAMALEALSAVGEAPPTPILAASLLPRLESSSPEIRLRVLDILARRPELSAFAPLARYIERRVKRGLSRREAEEYGRGLARLAPAAALPLFKGWVSAADTNEGGAILLWVAASGLLGLEGEAAKRTLSALEQAADDELKAHVARSRSGVTNA